MWSDKYYYFEIRSDDAYRQTTGAAELLKYLIKDLHFIADGVDGVEGNSDQPWMKLSLVVASINGNFSTQKSCPEQINLISVVGLGIH